MHTGEQTPWDGRGDAVVPQRVDEAVQTEVGMLETEEQDDVDSVVPTVRVCLLQTVRVPPQQCVMTRVTSNSKPLADLLVFEPNEEVQQECGILMEDSLLHPSEDGTIQVTLTNPTGITQVMEAGEMMGHVTEAMVVCAEEEEITPVRIMSARRDTEWACARERSRQLKLRETIGDLELPPAEQETFQSFLAGHHHAFCLEEGERGETDLIRMEIDTGDAHPRKQRVRRLPFALRRVVARQLREMQEQEVIQPSKSPWASPVVLVKKRDGTHRFCVDYRGLNAVTKPDSFPLPRIDYLLDVLGQAKYFSSIDLAWQIRMDCNSQEKTAFVTPQGLFEFRVMPFGLMNAPAVFQRLMQQVISSLNSDAEPEFVSVYIDDILIFSRTLEDHLHHLQRVIERVVEVGLKLKPTKCRFAQKEVEYLGHIVSCEGLKPNPRLVVAVQEFPVPRTPKATRRFLGLASFYRKFIPQFAAVANPLHHLTRRDTVFVWSPECQQAYQELKIRLTSAPILAYPNFKLDFVLETDASIEGLGAVLGQFQMDNELHPVSYASRALNGSERKYGITELETLAVVWGISHFHHLLYGHDVTVYTDHTAVKAVLEAENPTAKHARWWMRVYGRGIKNVKILYRAGKENSNADALSRSPYLPAPAVGIAEDEVQVSALIAGSSGGESSHGPALLGREIEGETSHSTVSADEYNPSQEEMKQSTEDNQLATPQPIYAENPARARRRIQKLQERVVLFSHLPFPSAEEDGPTPDLPVVQNPVESTATGTSGDWCYDEHRIKEASCVYSFVCLSTARKQ